MLANTSAAPGLRTHGVAALYELETAFHRCLPKDDSHRTVFAPGRLSSLLADHVTRTAPSRCACHGHRYVFGGFGTANGAARRTGPKLADVAGLAGVSTGTGNAPKPVRPVPLLADPWPGIPLRGRNAAERSQACWLPIANDSRRIACGTRTRR
jgi:hypothetical protein